MKKKDMRNKGKKRVNGTSESQQSSHSSRLQLRLPDTERNNDSSSQVPP